MKTKIFMHALCVEYNISVVGNETKGEFGK